MSEGVVLLSLKEAVILPLLKKPLLDLTILDNFYPITYLPLLGKVVELLCNSFRGLWGKEDCLNPLQSGLKCGYGRETALVMLLDDFWHG